MTFKQIQDLINLVNDSNISELKLEQGDFKISLKSQAYVEAMQSGKVTMSQMPVMPQFAQPSQFADQMPANPGTDNSSKPLAEPESKSDAAPSASEGLITIKSPMIGTFYRSPSPDKDPYVKIGDTITSNTVLCIIEAMKLFNEIEAEVSGKIVKILVEDNSPVEYDQPLFLVEPI